MPGMEDYLAIVRRYKGEFVRQEKVNASLKKEVEAGKIGIHERMDAQQLRKNYEKLKTIYDAIPEDIRREAVASLKTQQRQPRERERGR